jgi:hypothetical protein
MPINPEIEVMCVPLAAAVSWGCLAYTIFVSKDIQVVAGHHSAFV